MLKSLGKKIVSIVFGFNLPDECVYVSVSYRLLNGNAYSTQLYKSIPHFGTDDECSTERI